VSIEEHDLPGCGGVEAGSYLLLGEGVVVRIANINDTFAPRSFQHSLLCLIADEVANETLLLLRRLLKRFAPELGVLVNVVTVAGASLGNL